MQTSCGAKKGGKDWSGGSTDSREKGLDAWQGKTEEDRGIGRIKRNKDGFTQNPVNSASSIDPRNRLRLVILSLHLATIPNSQGGGFFAFPHSGEGMAVINEYSAKT